MTQFSIVIPVYNRATQVRDLAISLKRQTFADYECLVVDDGSSDGDLLKRWIEELDDARFKYFRQENAGGGAARNMGIELSEGEWICFLDSDDDFSPDKLQILAGHVRSNPEIIIWAHRALVVRADGLSFLRPTRMPRAQETITQMMFKEREFLQTSTLTVRADWAKRVRFDSQLRKAQDVDFVVRLERAGAKFVCLPDVLSVWNDLPADGRVGSPKKPRDVSKWYEAQKAEFTQDIRYAFEATYLSYEISSVEPIRAMFLIGRAFSSGAIGPRMFLMSMLRAFVPPGFYRSLLNLAVKIKRQPQIKS